MIVTHYAGVAYRMHTPRWASMPLSGAGAARHGGRANRPGVPALYLSLSTTTAIEEYKQTSRLLPPGTLVAYQVDLQRLVDYRAYDASTWSVAWGDFLCDWRAFVFNLKVDPPSWLAADEALKDGHTGIVFPSTVAQGDNLVVYHPEALPPGDHLSVHDPNRALPKNQSSWP